MKIKGKIIRVRSLKRDSFGNNGITIVFQTELGELTRTFNIPIQPTQRCLLIKALKTFPIKIPFNLLDKPALFCLALEKILKEIECNLSITPTGKVNYPYNILEMLPILTVNNKYSTANNQETLSTKAFV